MAVLWRGTEKHREVVLANFCTNVCFLSQDNTLVECQGSQTNNKIETISTCSKTFLFMLTTLDST